MCATNKTHKLQTKKVYNISPSFSVIAKEFPDRISTMFACLETCFGIGLIIGPSVGS